MDAKTSQLYWSECHKHGIFIIPELMNGGTKIRLDVEFVTNCPLAVRHRYTKVPGKKLYPNECNKWGPIVHEFYEWLYNEEILHKNERK